jgi:hypothetical protein
LPREKLDWLLVVARIFQVGNRRAENPRQVPDVLGGTSLRQQPTIAVGKELWPVSGICGIDHDGTSRKARRRMLPKVFSTIGRPPATISGMLVDRRSCSNSDRFVGLLATGLSAWEP